MNCREVLDFRLLPKTATGALESSSALTDLMIILLFVKYLVFLQMSSKALLVCLISAFPLWEN